MKINRMFFVTLVFSILVLVLIACSGGNESSDTSNDAQEGATEDAMAEKKEEQITIKIADSFPDSHLIPKFATKPWIDRIEELSDGKVTVEYYPAEQLGKADSLLDVAKNKVADITYVGPLYIGDIMPLSGIAANPGLFQDAVSATKAYNKLVKEDLYELEFKPNGVKPLWAAGTNPYQISNSKHPVEDLEDFEGLKIRTSGGIQEEVIESLGGTPVSVSGPEIYTSWDRGTIDGTLLGLFSWPGYQVDKVAKYATTNAPLSGFGITYVVNEEVWNSWPKDVQDAITQASDELVEDFGHEVNKYEEELMEEYADSGIEFYELPEEKVEEWNEELSSFNQQWAEDLDAKGLPATEILEKYHQYSEEFSE